MFTEEQAVNELRRLKAKGWADIQCMNELGMSRATFYKYKSIMRKQAAEEILTLDKASLMEDINMAKTRLEDCLRRIEEKLDAKRQDNEQPLLTASQTLSYVEKKAEISLSLAKIQYETPEILGKGILENEEPDTSEHFKQSTDSNKREQEESVQ